jgi:hypothetical protein
MNILLNGIWQALPRLLLLSLVTVSLPATAAAATDPVQAQANAPLAHRQRAGFTSAADAVSALATAMRNNDHARLHEILGEAADRYVQSSDAALDNEARVRFLHAYEEMARIELKSQTQAILHIGEDDWPLPFPLLQQGGRWTFDAKAGEQEWRDRRIGSNELSAIQVCLAYVDAQREYVLKDRDQDGLLEYAQRIVSSDGKHDGLYWPTGQGEPVSPMGQAFASADWPLRGIGRLESKPFHGYFFRLLTAQGKSAPGGALDYMVNNQLIGGFALIATPAQYRVSGIKSFIVNHDGVVYSKDLGPRTADLAQTMTRFDPDSSWHREQP